MVERPLHQQDENDLMASIYQTEISPHTMPVHLGHLNYQPSKLEDAVDKWHHDTIPLDYVMMVSDPAKLSGGGFEYFVGTKNGSGGAFETRENAAS